MTVEELIANVFNDERKFNRVMKEIIQLTSLPEEMYDVQINKTSLGLKIKIGVKPVALSKYGLKNFNEGKTVNFDILLNENFPYEAPKIFCMTRFVQPSLMDSRDLLEDILQKPYVSSVLLDDIVQQIPDLIKDIKSQITDYDFLIQLGDYYIGDDYSLADFESYPNTFLFNAVEIIQKSKQFERILVVTESNLLSFQADFQNPYNNQVSRLVNFYSLSLFEEIKEEKIFGKDVIIIKWQNDHKKQSSQFSEVIFQISEREKFLQKFQAQLQLVGKVKQHRQNKQGFNLEDVTAKQYDNMDIDQIVENIQILENQLEVELDVNSITTLINLYGKAIEYLSAKGDEQFKFFMDRMQDFLSKEDIQAVLQYDRDDKNKDKSRQKLKQGDDIENKKQNNTNLQSQDNTHSVFDDYDEVQGNQQKVQQFTFVNQAINFADKKRVNVLTQIYQINQENLSLVLGSGLCNLKDFYLQFKRKHNQKDLLWIIKTVISHQKLLLQVQDDFIMQILPQNFVFEEIEGEYRKYQIKLVDLNFIHQNEFVNKAYFSDDFIEKLKQGENLTHEDKIKQFIFSLGRSIQRLIMNSQNDQKDQQKFLKKNIIQFLEESEFKDTYEYLFYFLKKILIKQQYSSIQQLEDDLFNHKQISQEQIQNENEEIQQNYQKQQVQENEENQQKQEENSEDEKDDSEEFEDKKQEKQRNGKEENHEIKQEGNKSDKKKPKRTRKSKKSKKLQLSKEDKSKEKEVKNKEVQDNSNEKEQQENEKEQKNEDQQQKQEQDNEEQKQEKQNQEKDEEQNQKQENQDKELEKQNKEEGEQENKNQIQNQEQNQDKELENQNQNQEIKNQEQEQQEEIDREEYNKLKNEVIDQKFFGDENGVINQVFQHSIKSLLKKLFDQEMEIDDIEDIKRKYKIQHEHILEGFVYNIYPFFQHIELCQQKNDLKTLIQELDTQFNKNESKSEDLLGLEDEEQDNDEELGKGRVSENLKKGIKLIIELFKNKNPNVDELRNLLQDFDLKEINKIERNESDLLALILILQFIILTELGFENLGIELVEAILQEIQEGKIKIFNEIQESNFHFILGYLYYQQRDQKSLIHFKKSYMIRCQVYGKTSVFSLGALQFIAISLNNNQQNDISISLFSYIINNLQTLERKQQTAIQILKSMIAYSKLLFNSDKKQEAFQIAEQTVQMFKDRYSQNTVQNQIYLVEIYQLFANLYLYNNEVDKAKIYFQKINDVFQTQFKDLHPYKAAIYYQIGTIYVGLENLEVGLQQLSEALNLRTKIYGENHKSVVQSYMQIGYTYYNIGDLNQAIKYFQKSQQIQESLDKNSIDLLTIYEMIQKCLIKTNQTNLTWETIQNQQDIFEKFKNSKQNQYLRFLDRKVKCLEIMKQDVEVIKIQQQIVDIMKQQFDDIKQKENKDFNLYYAQKIVQLSLKLEKDPEQLEKAIDQQQEAIDIVKKFLGEDNMQLVKLYRVISKNLVQVGKAEESVQFIIEGLQILQEKNVQDDEILVLIKDLAFICKTLMEQDQIEVAFQINEVINNHLLVLFGEDSPVLEVANQMISSTFNQE
ncbi:Ubiquitin-conjugating enzyme/RWD-like protein [Pseudocohnilembus persalinus]|uniref:Ubiquitin-conjugating enzyme/RWD-like protein n=1 Tax=Pseudocohnilembus persalinus TaxID=266149 RepID=A0A0V0QJ35_PSEPJ|nr:Ubiquitin-conjugating enzyme/RWD-like protein [Pseudocohnilembus persalinus]|eukprot:KRX02053.1 Ubiquitin-conjugating enzyme/RWD-like protein [Pseudocohnilembus persalinus]